MGYHSKVCILAPDHAEALELRHVTPDCNHHKHCTQAEADRMIAAERDPVTHQPIEGFGQARTVRSTDGKRRITPIASILFYASKPSRGLQGFAPGQLGYVGPHTLQAVMAELH